MTFEDEEHLDDATIRLQMQQFLDEWHYRVLHANMAVEWDRTQTVMAAMDLFEAHGLVLEEEEKRRLAQLDESKMVEKLVKRMGPELRRTFEHFTLQLQLIVSTAARVRTALDEEGDPGLSQQIQTIVEEGDTGITQQILKQTIVEAGVEVAELRDVHGTWSKNMRHRIERLHQTALRAEQAKQELKLVNGQIDVFGSIQNEKARKALEYQAVVMEQALLKTSWAAWRQVFLKNKAENHIHEKYQGDIQEATTRSLQLKAGKATTVRKVLQMTVAGSDTAFVQEVVRRWAQAVRSAREGAEVQAVVTKQQDRLAEVKSTQSDRAKQTMLRIAAGSDDSMKAWCFQVWTGFVDEYRKEKDFVEKKQSMDKQQKALKVGQSKHSRGVLARLALTTDTVILTTIFATWVKEYELHKKDRHLDREIGKQEQKFSMMKSKTKASAHKVTDLATRLEQENLLMTCFMNWVTELQLDRLIRHYSGKMETKKHQLEAVQMMFKNFATQLNQLDGINGTPRKSAQPRSSSRPGEARPPAIPA